MSDYMVDNVGGILMKRQSTLIIYVNKFGCQYIESDLYPLI